MKQSTLWTAINLLLTLALFLARPGILGEHLGVVYLAVAILLIGSSLFVGRSKGVPLSEGLVLIIGYGVYWGYRIFQVLSAGRDEALADICKSVVFEAVTVALVLTVLADEKRRHHFFSFFCGALALLGFSSIISEILSWLGQADAISLYTFKRTASEESRDFVLQFPFSFAYDGYVGRSAVKLYRYTGGFIEAGIYPSFGCWAIAYTALSPLRKPWVIIGCLLGIVATFSTAAVVCLSAMVPVLALALLARTLRLSLPLKLFTSAAIIFAAPALLAAVYFAPDIGLDDKAVTHGTSLDDRSNNIQRGISSLPTNPYGHFNLEEHQSICLLGASYTLGSVGLLLWVVKLGSTVCSRNNDLLKVAACITPLLLTLSIAQPLFDAMPAVIVLFFTRFAREPAVD